MADSRPWTGRARPMEPEEGFLRRWARRKRDAQSDTARTGIHAESTDPSDHAARDSGSNAAPAGSDVVLSKRRSPDPGQPELPPLDAIDGSTDVSGYLSERVDEELRRLALRRVFHSARFNVRCPLDDYADDYSRYQPLGGLVTADMRHRASVEAERRARELVRQEAEAPATAVAPPSPDVTAEPSPQHAESPQSTGPQADGAGRRARPAGGEPTAGTGVDREVGSHG